MEKRTGFIGLVSDVTLPSTDHDSGRVLIDKICEIKNHKKIELFDYHIWLDMEEVRLVFNKNEFRQKVAIGDVLVGRSKVVSYVNKDGQDKYGFGPTLLGGAGVFKEDPWHTKLTLMEDLITDYDRGNDWVMDIQSPETEPDIQEQMVKQKDISILKNSNKRVIAEYQYSKYDHFYDRFAKNTKDDNTNPDMHMFYAKLESLSYTKRGKHYIPLITLMDIRDQTEDNQFVSNSETFRYTPDMWRTGKLKRSDELGFYAKYTWTDYFGKTSYTHKSLTSPKGLGYRNKRAIEPLPLENDAIVGYIMDEKDGYKNDFLVNKYHRWQQKVENDDSVTSKAIVSDYNQTRKEKLEKQDLRQQKLDNTMRASDIAKTLNTVKAKIMRAIEILNIFPSFYSVKRQEKRYDEKAFELISEYIMKKEKQEKIKNITLYNKQEIRDEFDLTKSQLKELLKSYSRPTYVLRMSNGSLINLYTKAQIKELMKPKQVVTSNISSQEEVASPKVDLLNNKDNDKNDSKSSNRLKNKDNTMSKQKDLNKTIESESQTNKLEEINLITQTSFGVFHTNKFGSLKDAINLINTAKASQDSLICVRNNLNEEVFVSLTSIIYVHKG